MIPTPPSAELRIATPPEDQSILMILLPFYYDSNKPLILIGIIPLWLGAYSLIYGEKLSIKEKNTKQNDTN